jgi:hypothetical protein
MFPNNPITLTQSAAATGDDNRLSAPSTVLPQSSFFSTAAHANPI